LRITDEQALTAVKHAAGVLRVEIEALLSQGLPNSPMAGAQIRVNSGNFITARPIGVRKGVDFLYTGAVRKVDAAALAAQLDAHRYTDGLAFMPPASATNNTAAGRTPYQEPDPQHEKSFAREWHTTELTAGSNADLASKAFGVRFAKMAALFTSTSTCPSSATDWATILSTEDGSLTSTTTSIASPSAGSHEGRTRTLPATSIGLWKFVHRSAQSSGTEAAVTSTCSPSTAASRSPRSGTSPAAR
jgi:hypothetical protein